MRTFLECIWWRIRHQDKGSVLMEAVIAMGLASVLILYSSTATTGATNVQRLSVNQSIAAQASQTTMESLRASGWNKIGAAGPACPQLKPANVTLPRLADGMTFAPLLAAGPGADPTLPVTIRNLPVTICTAVGWLNPPSSATGQYGTKIVVGVVFWKDAGNGPLRDLAQQVIITSGVDQTVPSGVRGS